RIIYSQDAKTLITGSSRVLQFVDVETGKEVGPRHGHTQDLASIWFTSDGKIATRDNQSTRTWDSTGKELASTAIKLPTGGLPRAATAAALLRAASATTVSPDGRYVITSPSLYTKGAKGEVQREAVLYETSDAKELCRIALEADVMRFGLYGR